MLASVLTLAAVAAPVSAAAAPISSADRPWMTSLRAAPPATRAAAVLAKMNQTEKIAMLHGVHLGYVGNVLGNTRLGIPQLNLNDGPQGFRGIKGTSTQWPSALAVAASWDVENTGAWGTGMGKEFFQKGANVQLGPGACLARVPVNGRNFEYVSGEDPFLGYTLIAPVIKGIQSQGVIANAKHWINNNQETNRGAVSENVDERTEHEMYFPPFEGAVNAGLGSIMCSYNKINNTWSCENPNTLGTDAPYNGLKGANSLNFSGWVMSDWGATHSTSLTQGLDQEMPGSKYMNEGAITAGLSAGTITQKRIDDAVMRQLTPMFQVGVFDLKGYGKLTDNVTSAAHNMLARKLSAEATVLLKNEGGVLPLKSTTQKIAVIGWADGSHIQTGGGGSGSVAPYYQASPFAAIKKRVAGSVYLDGKDTAAAATAAKAADVAIVFVATTSSEGSDRKTLALKDNGDALVAAVAAAQPNTIVVAATPGALLTPWSSSVKALLTNFMPGQESGNAIADVLFGDVNPSGKLPLTFPNKDNEVDFAPRNYPGIFNDKADPKQQEAYYEEKLLVGYRYYDAKKITPKFAFGFGLSYTTFKYSDIKATKDSVSFTLTNSGSVKGAEVAQVYLGFPASAGEPPLQLKGFKKVMLAPGAKATVTIKLTDRSFSTWDVGTHGWKVEKGSFSVQVGGSSRNAALTGSITV